MSDGLYLSAATFKRFSPATRSEILGALGIGHAHESGSDSQEHSGTSATQFSLNEMRKFLDGVSDKTRLLLTEIARAEARFNVGKVLKKLGWELSDIRGILAGITKRSRTISGNPRAEFFASVAWDDDINKAVSEIHPTTHAALRALLLSKNS
ncbi:hypothetical protein CV770_34405 [Bradyrhizobium sp. AC87j1]|uniref:hypothetical protein n=1 Tax=Bradyrhizobium sp. AC87j1 TaxID=2055894 RepID=UPI000CEC9E7E|nr:hypothetical protein [Bradyrhizobium sp. AC87j1]PPQ14918.1 hypothetical protein CV770_34405 [Bradyrhizobium sp. AC87j1]